MALNDQRGRFSGTTTAPVQRVRPSEPANYVDASSCEMWLQIGIFFDGTGNNRYRDEGKLAHSNVARLYKTYPGAALPGCHAIYIPGLGTPFPEVGEDEDTTLGGAFAMGGDSRLAYTLLQVFNAISQSLFRRDTFSKPMSKVLCKRGALSQNDMRLLQGWGLSGNFFGEGGAALRTRLLGMCADAIRGRLEAEKIPKVHECVFDIFGFSRGAAEARAFCHWLSALMEDKKLAGIPCRFRFLGIMDTVASVGVLDGVKNSVTGQTGGHTDWAIPEMMHVLPSVENCVHLVAMHEFRKNFPLDSVIVNGSLPSNCLEFAYPGSHSDVGGGYLPGELGVAIGAEGKADTLKLSQIPLNHMFECAVKAGVPLSLDRLKSDAEKASFEIHVDLKAAFDKFFKISTIGPRSLNDWALPYLVWRWNLGVDYIKTGQYTKADSVDKAYLSASNGDFCFYDELMQRSEDASKKKTYNKYDSTSANLALLELEAAELRSRVKAQSQVDPALAAFFDDYVHDSLAGFRRKLVERTSYWRYRRVFYGSGIPYTG